MNHRDQCNHILRRIKEIDASSPASRSFSRSLRAGLVLRHDCLAHEFNMNKWFFQRRIKYVHEHGTTGIFK